MTETDPLLRALSEALDGEVVFTPAPFILAEAAAIAATAPVDVEAAFKHYCGLPAEEVEGRYKTASQIINLHQKVKKAVQAAGIAMDADGLIYQVEILREVLEQARKWHTARDERKTDAAYHQAMREAIDVRQLKFSVRPAEGDFMALQAEADALLETYLDNPDFATQAQSIVDRFEATIAKYNLTEEHHKGSRKIRERSYSIQGTDIAVPRLNYRGSFLRRLAEVLPAMVRFQALLPQLEPAPELLAAIPTNKLEFGAKAAHLMFLRGLQIQHQRVWQRIRIQQMEVTMPQIVTLAQASTDDVMEQAKAVEELINAARNVQLPNMPATVPSVYIPVELYQRWQAGENVDEELYELYQQIQDLAAHEDTTHELAGWVSVRLMARSSAVYSEDNPALATDGLYESIGQIPREEFDTFKNVVENIWASATSDEAVAMQQEHGIADEAMGVVLQPDLNAKGDSLLGQVDSAKPYHPGLVEVRTERGDVALLQASRLPLDFFSHATNLMAAQFNPDRKEFALLDRTIAGLAFWSKLLERWLGEPQQQEFITEAGGEACLLLQTKPLVQPESVELPELLVEAPLLFKGRGVGVFCERLDRHELFTGSNSERLSMANLVKVHHRAVLMISSFNTSDGHIESLCLKVGVKLIVDDPFQPFDAETQDWPDDLLIVSNGIEARVYDATNLPADEF